MALRALLIVFACLYAAAPAAHAGPPRGFVGLYGDDAFFGDPDYRVQHLSAQARLGVQIARQPFEWWRVERSPGEWDFADYDAYVAGAARAGIGVLPVLMAPPEFRSSRPAHSRSRAMFPPKSNAAYARFVRAAVRRYGSSGSFWRTHPKVPYLPIRSWQVWNEPNIPNFWRSGPDASEYVALLRVASQAIRSADPGAEVVAAGLPNSHLGVPFRDYLEGMYEAGARGLYDSLAIHPYARDVGGLLHLVENARLQMNAEDDTAGLWITEFGWSTGGDASAFRVSERGQADRIAAAVSALATERRALGLRGFVLFKWKDSIAPPEMGGDPWPLHTGLLDAWGGPKRGLWVFGRLLQGLRRETGTWAKASAEPARIPPRRTVRLSPLGHAPVSLGCAVRMPGACGGTLRLQSARPVRCGRDSRAAGAEIGRATFRVAVAPALVPVRLTRASRRLAQCIGRLRVRATVSRTGTARAAIARSAEFDLRAR